jgi:hypothetical protein
VFRCSKLPCLGWRSAIFLQGFFRPKCLQELFKHARSSTKISMDRTCTVYILKYDSSTILRSSVATPALYLEINSATRSSLVRFEDKTIFFTQKKNALAFYIRCRRCKFRRRRIGSWIGLGHCVAGCCCCCCCCRCFIGRPVTSIFHCLVCVQIIPPALRNVLDLHITSLSLPTPCQARTRHCAYA